MKKIISVITALLVMAICLCPSLALAAGKPAFEVSSAKAARNESADITIAIKNNPGITSAKLIVKFDDALVLKQAQFGNELTGNKQHSKELKSPFTLNWFIGTADLKKDLVFATLTFAAGSEAKEGDYDISLTYDKEDVYNLKEENIDFKVVGGKLTVTGDPGEVLTGNYSAAAKSSSSGGEVIGGDNESAAPAQDKASKAAVEPKVVETPEVAASNTTGTYEGSGEFTGPELSFDEEGNPVETAPPAEDKSQAGAVGNGTDIKPGYNGDGEFTGPELSFDEDGNPIEEGAEEAEEQKTGCTAVWLGVGAAVLVIAAAVVVLVVVRKRKNGGKAGE